MADDPYTREEFTASDGYVCHYRHYSAAAPRGHVVYLHGIQSHAGWYEYSCTRLAQAGYEVSFLDRRGSGENKQARGDTPSFPRLLLDLAEFLQPLRDKSTPVFLAAVSWGGKPAVALQRFRPGLVDGLALLCPGFFPKVKMPLRQRLAIVRARILAPTKLYPIPLNDPELFTANPDWLAFLREDPLALHEATARFLTISARLDVYLRAAPKHVTIPVLLLLAGQDRIIDNEATRRFVERFAAADKKIIEYPQAHHTLEFEPNPDEAIDDLLAWLNERTP